MKKTKVWITESEFYPFYIVDLENLSGYEVNLTEEQIRKYNRAAKAYERAHEELRLVIEEQCINAEEVK